MIGLVGVLMDRSLAATWEERRGSAAVKPRAGSGERRKGEGRRRRVGLLREVVEEGVVGRREKAADDAAEAIGIAVG